MSAGGAEVAAPYISKWLYGKDKGSDLTAEEKETVSAITNLLGTVTGAAVGNSATDAAQGSLNAQSAVKNNSELFDDVRQWTRKKAENAANASRQLFPDAPVLSGAFLGLGDVADGGLGLTDAAAESLAMAIHCVSGLDYCNTAMTNNQERGKILLDTARAVTDGRIKNALTHWGNNLLYGTPEQQKQATEQLARVSTTLGIGTAVSAPKVNPLYRPVSVVSNAKVGIQWNAGIAKQGYPWENYVGKSLPADARLPPNFKTFDYYDVNTKTAISVKTLDTQTASRRAKPEQIYSTMKGYVDKVANFSEYKLSGQVLRANMIKQREIHLAVPANTNTAQRQQLQRVVEYGKSRNVQIKITEIK